MPLLYKKVLKELTYYNFLKDRKAAYREQKAKTQRKIIEIYHQANGVPVYRMMRDLLVPYGLIYCNATIYKYMLELGLRSIVRRKKPNYHKGKANKTFPNLFSFKSEQEMDDAVKEFAYGWYNRVRPHTYNGGLTPSAA